jgi:hypothetical protein
MDRKKKGGGGEQRTALPWRPENGLVFTPRSRKSESYFCDDDSGVQRKG